MQAIYKDEDKGGSGGRANPIDLIIYTMSRSKKVDLVSFNFLSYFNFLLIYFPFIYF